jgi:hypothetical protein
VQAGFKSALLDQSESAFGTRDLLPQFVVTCDGISNAAIAIHLIVNSLMRRPHGLSDDSKFSISTALCIPSEWRFRFPTGETMKDIKLNAEQRLYVLRCGDGYTCFGFDNCYRDAVAMAERMNALKSVNNGLEYIAPTADMIGTIECYEAYQALGQQFAKHPASKRTWFTPGTPTKVQSMLENARKNRSDNRNQGTILRLFLGDPETGRDWCEEWDVVGFIGRSTGSQKVPLLIEPLWSSYGDLESAEGGGAISTDGILRIIEFNTGNELYRHPKYQLPAFTIHAVEADKTHPIKVKRDNQEQAAFATHEAAGEFMAFMQGYRVSRPFRTRAEYLDEMREAA